MYQRFTGRTRAELEADIYAVLKKGWRYETKWYLRYWAKQYYASYPGLLNEDGTLQGFSPRGLLAYFWPGEDNRGERQSHIREEMHKWAEKARLDKLREALGVEST
jgi:hypothetical protein